MSEELIDLVSRLVQVIEQERISQKVTTEWKLFEELKEALNGCNKRDNEVPRTSEG